MIGPEEFSTLFHTIGMKTRNYRRSDSWWLDNDNHRNHWCSSNHTVSILVVRLIAAGFMRFGRVINDGEDVYFHVTPAGIIAAKREYTRARQAQIAEAKKEKADRANPSRETGQAPGAQGPGGEASA